jgi:YD repeat-containing protein
VSYDTRYRLGAWTLGNLLSYTHSYNRDSNLVARADLKASANNRTFGYDEIHRLTNAAGPWGAGTYCSGATYEYDQNGNRKCKGETNATTAYTYTTGTNRLAAATGAEPATYGYDANGNTVDDGPFRYAYNDAGRLATVNEGAVATYTYDGENRRVIKTTPTATTYYFYDPSGRLIQEFDPASNAGEDYLSLHAAPIARMHWSWTVQPPIEDDSVDPGENTNDVGRDRLAAA